MVNEDEIEFAVVEIEGDERAWSFPSVIFKNQPKRYFDILADEISTMNNTGGRTFSVFKANLVGNQMLFEGGSFDINVKELERVYYNKVVVK